MGGTSMNLLTELGHPGREIIWLEVTDKNNVVVNVIENSVKPTEYDKFFQKSHLGYVQFG